MSGHKTVSISSLLSPGTDSFNPTFPQQQPEKTNDLNNNITLSLNSSNNTASNIMNNNLKMLINPDPTPLSPKPLSRTIEEVRSERESELKRKTSSPMSVMNLMNSPILEDTKSKSVVSVPVETIPELQQELTPTKTKKGTKKDLQTGGDIMGNKKEKPKKTEDSEKVTTKETEENGPTIISIDIPLSTHNDIHSEHNFAKLVEEKYGINDTQAPLTKGLWNFDADDADGDDDDEDEEEADLDGDSGANNPITNDYEDEDDIVKALQIKFTPGMSDMEKETLVLKEIHRRKMVNNKRIGKYDIDDPFIDDEELEFEEETGANADGWFIWHGKLEVSKKRKTSPTESKGDRPVKLNKSNNNSISTPAGRPKAQHNSAIKGYSDFVTIAPSANTDRRRKMPVDSSTSAQPTAKRAKKVIAQTTKLPTPGPAIASPLSLGTRNSETENSEKKDTTTGNNKLIIGSFGFGN